MLNELLSMRAQGETWAACSEHFGLPVTTLRTRARQGVKQTPRKTAPLTMRRVLSGRDGRPRYIKTSSLLAFFSQREIKESGLAHLTRDYGTPLDLLAQSLEIEGHMLTPSDRNPDEYLLELLERNALSLQDSGHCVEIEYREWIESQRRE